MDSTLAPERFDWIGWLATIPGIPSDWGMQAPQEPGPPDIPDDACEWPALLAA